MPLKCFQKPNRTRVRFWNAKKVGQVACIALRSGASRVEIEGYIAECVGGERRNDPSEAEQALAVAEQALSQNNVVLDADADSLRRFQDLGILNPLVLRILARVPVVGPALATGIVALSRVAASQLARIAVQKAANDAALTVVRRAAANAARFRQTGT